MLDTQTDQVTVEAETVEDALAEISAEFGENAEIVRAQKLHRGGVGGFFAKEVVQLTARRRRDEAPSLRPRPQGSGIADVLERMAQDADAEDSDFRTVLKRELGPEPAEPVAAELLATAAEEEVTDDVEALPASTDIVEPVNAAEQAISVPAEVEAIPAPVAVGPVLRSVPDSPVTPFEEECPVDNLIEFEPELEPETSLDLVFEPAFEPELELEPDLELEAEPVAGPVVPLREPAGTDFDEAAAEEVVPEAASDREVAEHDSDNDEPGDWRASVPTDAPAGMGPVGWSKTAMLRIGLPAPVLSAAAGLDPSDDLGWIESIAAVVAPHCRPLPVGDVIVVGPHAERLAEPLGLPLVRSGDMAPYDGSFCAMVEDSAQDRQWLEFVRGGRGIHLVVGDEPWQDLLIDEPVAVSWVGEKAVVDALYLAFTLGAALGFGTTDGFVSSMVRAQPTDVALAVRRIVGRR